MRKKLISVGFLCIFVGILSVIICQGPGERDLIRQIFGFDLDEYEVINVDCELDPFIHGGHLWIDVMVREEQMDQFQSEMEAAGFRSGEGILKGQTTWHCLIDRERETLNHSLPPYNPIIHNISYFDPEDGVYEVRMVYSE